MSKTITAPDEFLKTFDPIIDPVAYLASLGIEAQLVSVEQDTLAEAA